MKNSSQTAPNEALSFISLSDWGLKPLVPSIPSTPYKPNLSNLTNLLKSYFVLSSSSNEKALIPVLSHLKEVCSPSTILISEVSITPAVNLLTLIPFGVRTSSQFSPPSIVVEIACGPNLIL